MEKALQRVQGNERLNIFGVRHLSPGASWHLKKYLSGIKPKCVLIEGPSDAQDIIPQLADKKVKPPVAILAYTAELPVDTLLYPFADYSPEYQAILWAVKNKSEVRFIDLPTSVSLGFNRYKNKKDNAENSDEPPEKRESFNIYEKIANLAGENDYDSYWERNFEHNLNEGVFNESLCLQSGETRQLSEPEEFANNPESFAYNQIRETYMRNRIHEAVKDGFKPSEIVVITGAYHAGILQNLLPEAEVMDKLPRADSKLTLMPYSYYRLSSQSGYGAGNNAPAYYQTLWEHLESGGLSELSAHYISSAGRVIRENGGYCSTANVIEAVRLSNSLAYMKGGHLPVLSDLHDAIISCIGHGEKNEVATAFAMCDVGTAIGELPEGVSQTPVQDDMNRELKRLKLEKYKSSVSQELDLDLRENRKVKSEEAAFIDLSRSTFLHRLKFLNIDFARQIPVKNEGATWAEKWVLQWTPESEIQIVEATLKGETIEVAATYVLKEKLDVCADISEASKLVAALCVCELEHSMELALGALQRLAADSSNLAKMADAARELSMLILYGDIRNVDIEPMKPLLQEIFLRSALMLNDAAGCDDKAAGIYIEAIKTFHEISQSHFDLIDDDLWVKKIRELAARDDKNAKISGYCFAVLLDRNLADEDFVSKEISRRLSPGIPADIGAGWFEGVSMHNRQALLSRISLWKQLDGYVGSLDDEEFKRSVVFLRRAFGNFEPREKNSAAELLGDIWGINSRDVSIMLQSSLNEDEETALKELNDFDFDL